MMCVIKANKKLHNQKKTNLILYGATAALESHGITNLLWKNYELRTPAQVMILLQSGREKIHGNRSSYLCKQRIELHWKIPVNQ